MKFKKVIIVLLLAMVSFSGFLFGCGDKYDGLKVVSDKDETGLQLFLDEDSDMDGGDKPSIGEITFTVNGASNGVSTALKFNYDQNYIKLLNTKVDGNKTKVTLQAIDGGSSNFIAITEEGAKQDVVKVDCIRKITSLKFNPDYKPAIFNKDNSSIAINTKQIIFNDGNPKGTTQTEVEFYAVYDVNGVEVSKDGVVSIKEKIDYPDDYIVVRAKSLYDNGRNELLDDVFVKIIKTIEVDEIRLITEQSMYDEEENKILLTTDGPESYLTFDIDVNNTSENISVNYKLMEEDGVLSHVYNVVSLENTANGIHIYANNIGKCKLLIEVSLSDYSEIEPVIKMVDIEVIQLPKTISVNGIESNFSDTIYTFYQNGLGKKYNVNIGASLAYNKNFVVLTDNISDYIVKRVDGKIIKLGSYNDFINNQLRYGEYDVLPNNFDIYITGNNPNEVSNLYILAVGSQGHATTLIKKIELTTLLGSNSINPEFPDVSGEQYNQYFVEVGNEITLEYEIDYNSSAKNMKLVMADGSAINQTISVQISEEIKPVVKVFGLTVGEITCKFVLENLVESAPFKILSFLPLNYSDETEDIKTKDGFYVSVDSPLVNRNVAKVDYKFDSKDSIAQTLNSVVLARNSGTQLYITTNPSDGTVFATEFSVFIGDSNGNPISREALDFDVSNFVNINSSGFIVTKQGLPNNYSIVIDDSVVKPELFIKVKVHSLKTENNYVKIVDGEKNIQLTIYVPLSGVELSKTTSTIYWFESLNVIQQKKLSYQDTISLTFYPNSVNLNEIDITWDIDLVTIIDNENKNVTISAQNMPQNVDNTTIHTLTITIKYYSTIIVRRVIFTVIKAIKAQTIYVGVDDVKSNVAYFDISNPEIEIQPIKVNTKVFSASGKDDVTFKNVRYWIDPRDQYIATVNEKGEITPHDAGTCEMRVYAEDMISSEDDESPLQFKTITIIVADGVITALRIRTAEEFNNIKSDFRYYLDNNIYLNNEFYMEEFNGSIDGNNYYLNNVNLSKNGYLFSNLTSNARIVNLNINAFYELLIDNELIDTFELITYIDEDGNEGIYYNKTISGLSDSSRAYIENVNIQYSVASIKFEENLDVEKISKLNLQISGLINSNYSTISNCSVDMNVSFETINDSNYKLRGLYFGGMVTYNNHNLEGENDNYQYYNQNFVQQYNSNCKLFVPKNITVAESAIGGLVAKNEGNVGAFNNGLAVDVSINAESLNNVGGIAGINNGTIKNVLVVADITANNNVGGVAGSSVPSQENVNMGDLNYNNHISSPKVNIENNYIAKIDNVIVELYQDISNRENHGKIVGNENVGGLVGTLLGKYNLEYIVQTHKEQVAGQEQPIDIFDDTYNNLTLYYSNITNSYIKSYTDDGYIFGTNNVGGIAGKAELSNITSCFADVNINLMSEADVLGGAVGLAKSVNLQKAYYIGEFINEDNVSLTQSGLAIGRVEEFVFGEHKASEYNITSVEGFEYIDKSYINQFYSPSNISTKLVGFGEEFVIINQSYFVNDNLSIDNLKQISTYFEDENTEKTWKISQDSYHDDNLDWYINENVNNGYPVLIFNYNLMQKEMPTQINIGILAETTYNDIVILNTNTNYYLDQVLNITTNVNSKSNIFVYSSNDSVLSTRNLNNKLSNLATLYTTEQNIITLTFVLGNNPDINKKVQIAFIDDVLEFKIDDIHIKKGESASINANVSYVTKQSSDEPDFEPLSIENYFIGLPSNVIDNKITITNSISDKIENEILFKNNELLIGNDSFSKQVIKAGLYYRFEYKNLDGNTEEVYLQIAWYDNFNVSVYVGASSIEITTNSAELTLIDAITFTVVMKTDDEKDEILVNYDEISDKLDLHVIAGPSYQNGELVCTYELKFDDKYLDANNKEAVFNKAFNCLIKFTAKSSLNFIENDVQNSENIVSTNLNVLAKPQKLYRIDMINYPAGLTDGSKYVLSTSFENTLTPGQVGLIAIDVYPEFAYFDKIEIKSAQDNKGNRISFIQVALDNEKNNTYLEIKPSSVLTEEGIILQKISNIYTNSNKTSFDGRFYVKTLMGTNVDFDQKIKVTVEATTNIYDEDDNLIEVQVLTKEIEIIVNKAPTLKMEYQGKLYDGFVKYEEQQDSEESKVVTRQHHLAYVGQTLTFNVSSEKLIIKKIDPIIAVNSANDWEDEWFTASDVKGDKFTFTIDHKCEPGTLFSITLSATHIVNNFNETILSNTYEFMVVDYILLTNVIVNNNNNVFTIEQPENLNVDLNVIKFNGTTSENPNEYADLDENITYSINDLKSKINTTTNYWYGFKNGAWQNWKFDNNTESNFDAYHVYQLRDDNKITGFALNALKEHSNQNKFKVEFPFYYDYTGVNSGIILEQNEDMYQTANHVVTIDAKIDTDIERPIPIYTITQLYEIQSKPDVDYILMNDLYFGLSDREYEEFEGKNYTEDTYTKDAYKPFDLMVKSFDANTHTITIFGRIDLTENDNTLGIFKQIGASTILMNLNVMYYPIDSDNYENSYAINLSNIDKSTFTFGGLAATNFGVVSNCHVYYMGDVNISLKDSTARVNIAGFVSQNSGKITYSSVLGPDFNDFLYGKNLKELIENKSNITESIRYNKQNAKSGSLATNVKLQTTNPGNMATFVNTNSNLLSNCQSEFVGLLNQAPSADNSKVAGFVTTNSNAGNIVGCSVAGQRIKSIYEDKFILTKSDGEIINEFSDKLESPYPITNNDSRIERVFRYIYANDYILKSGTDSDTFKDVNKDIISNDIYNISDRYTYNAVKSELNKLYFARIESQATVAGFVYTNTGSITNAYASIPLDTQSRSSGFVYDNLNGGRVETSYTSSLFDGNSNNNTAHSKFVGTDELSQVLTDNTGKIDYCYYISENSSIYEEDTRFKEPAGALKIQINTKSGESTQIRNDSFVGFNFGNNSQYVWYNNIYQLPTLNACVNNLDTKKIFERIEKTEEDANGEKVVYFIRSGGTNNQVPLTIANALQFVKTFSKYSTQGVMKQNIRLINDIDLSEYSGQDEFNSIKNIIFNADFDGNGMKIEGIKISGAVDNKNTSIYSNASSAFGLFNQIGTATKSSDDINADYNFKDADKTTIRNLTISVKSMDRSSSVFTGILAGVIINTDIRNLTIKADNVTVLGRNAVGGVAGGIFGNSTLYNVSVNASVTSGAGSTSQSYRDKELEGKDGYENNEYKFINYYENDYSEYISGNGNNFDLLNGYTPSFSYAGGVAGIIDLYDVTSYVKNENNSETAVMRVRDGKKNKNVNLVKVGGNVVITGEVVGGLFGTINNNTLVANSKFTVSDSTEQQLNGYYTSGGLIGINNGGYLYLSYVQSDDSVADNIDLALTNTTGEHLFSNNGNTDIEVYPYAIGGLIGISKGGSIVSSYSKTNVINTNAKYAGGIVGYVINNKGIIEFNSNTSLNDKMFGEYISADEVYSTGNVLACDDYEIQNIDDKTVKYVKDNLNYKNVLNDSNEFSVSNGRKIELKLIGISKGYAGGFAGYIRYDEDDNNKDAYFNGVLGINAFHRPSNYTLYNDDYLPINTKIVDNQSVLTYLENKEQYSTSTLDYGSMASGYFGVKQLSTGEQQIVYFMPKIGSIFGKVETKNHSIFYGYQEGNTKTANLFTSFAYNTTNITTADCRNANGKVLTYYANATSDTQNANFTINNNANNIDTYEINIAGGTKNIFLNQESSYVDENSKLGFKSSASYLVIKGSNVVDVNGYNYSQLKQDDYGIYKYWSTNWTYNNPVYPKILPQDNSSYTPIYNEEQLNSMRSGGKYMLMNDIYLSKPRNPFSSFNNITLESAKRNDDSGIVYNGSKSLYYSIYNINLNTGSNATSNSQYGFFSTLTNSSVIKNVNFVFGTSFSGENVENDGITKIPVTYEDTGIGFKYSGTATKQKIGLLVGELVNQSSITNCNVYIADNINTSISIEGSTNLEDIRIGGFVGYSEKSYVNQSSINVVKTKDDNYHFDSNTLNLDVQLKYEDSNDESKISVGGFAGYVDVSEMAFSSNTINGLAVSVNGNSKKYGEINIGGFIGIANRYSIDNLYVNNDIEIEGIGESAELLNVGGAFGQIVGTDLDSINYKGEIIFNNSINALNGNIGGLVGLARNANIKNSYVKFNKVITPKGNYQYLRFGGLIGYCDILINREITISNSKSVFDTIDITDNVKTDNIYVGGFIGANNISQVLNNPKDIKYNNCLSLGDISLGDIEKTSDNYNIYACGFIAYGYQGSSNASYHGKIDGCVAAVDINITSTQKFNVSAFAGNYVKEIKNSIALGNIAYKSSNSTENSTKPIPNSAKISGFSLFDDTGNDETADRLQNWKNNYTLSNIKAVADSGDAIRATTFASKDVYSNEFNNAKVFYNYNLSSVYQDKTLGQELTYSSLIDGQKDAQGALIAPGALERLQKNLSISVDDSGEIISSFFKSEYEELTKEGKNINPFKAEENFDESSYNENDFVIFSNKQSDNQYNVNSDSDNQYNVNSDIVANYIADNSNHASTLILISSIDVKSNALISGFELALSNKDACLIDNNEGIIFNCVSVGKVASDIKVAKKYLSGFVYKNNGIINGSLSMAYIDFEHITKTAAGFVYNNYATILNSAATNVFLNFYDYTKPSAGFVYTNQQDGYIYNCFSAPSMYGLDKNNESPKGYSYNFIKDNKGTISSCATHSSMNKTDVQGIEKYDGDESKSTYQKTIEKTAEMFNKNKDTFTNCTIKSNTDANNNNNNVVYISDGNITQIPSANALNYGYATPTTYVLSNYNGNYATYNTGDNTQDNPYKVNNIGRFKYLTSKATSKIDYGAAKQLYLKLVNNIDASLEGNITSTYYYGDSNKNSVISICNDNLYVIDGLVLNSSTVNNQVIGLISANYIVLNNVGLIGKFSENKINISGDKSATSLFIGVAGFVKADNSFAILNEEVNIEKSNSFGLFAGKITGECDSDIVKLDNAKAIQNCFASGDYISQDGLYHATFIGFVEKDQTITNCFANGTTTVTDTLTKSQKYLGGLVGCVNTNNNINTCNNYVTIMNYATSKYNSIKVNPIANQIGSEQISSCYNNKYLSLCDSTEGCTEITNWQGSISKGWVNDSDNHYPIPKYLTETIKYDWNFVYKNLGISKTSRLGNKMSPIKINNLFNTSFNSNKYYEIINNNSGDEIHYSQSNLTITDVKMLIGNGKIYTFDGTSGNDYTPLFKSIGVSKGTIMGLATYYNPIITGITVNNSPFAEEFNGYACYINVEGTITNDDGFAFVHKNNVATFDKCSVGSKDNLLTFNSTSNDIRLFVKNNYAEGSSYHFNPSPADYGLILNKTIFRDITINAKVTNTSASQIESLSIAGINKFIEIGDNAWNAVTNSNVYSKFEIENERYNTKYVGMFDINIETNSNIQPQNVYIGGIYTVEERAEVIAHIDVSYNSGGLKVPGYSIFRPKYYCDFNSLNITNNIIGTVSTNVGGLASEEVHTNFVHDDVYPTISTNAKFNINGYIKGQVNVGVAYAKNARTKVVITGENTITIGDKNKNEENAVVNVGLVSGYQNTILYGNDDDEKNKISLKGKFTVIIDSCKIEYLIGIPFPTPQLYSYIGGLFGKVTRYGGVKNYIVNADVNVIDNSLWNANCFVGGIAGTIEDGNNENFANVVSKGLVAAVSHCTLFGNKAVKYNIQDARTYNEDLYECFWGQCWHITIPFPIGSILEKSEIDAFIATLSFSEQILYRDKIYKDCFRYLGRTNYARRETRIPLAVGGVFGYYNYNTDNTFASKFKKETGDVRGLLVEEDTEIDKLYNSTADWSDFVYNSDNNYTKQYINSETCRASVGGFAGLVKYPSRDNVPSPTKQGMTIRPWHHTLKCEGYEYAIWPNRESFNRHDNPIDSWKSERESYDYKEDNAFTEAERPVRSADTIEKHYALENEGMITYFSKTDNARTYFYKIPDFVSNFGYSVSNSNFVNLSNLNYDYILRFNYNGWDYTNKNGHRFKAQTDTINFNTYNIFNIGDSDPNKSNSIVNFDGYIPLIKFDTIWNQDIHSAYYYYSDWEYYFTDFDGNVRYRRNLTFLNDHMLSVEKFGFMEDVKPGDTYHILLNKQSYTVESNKPSVFAGYTREVGGEWVTENRSYWLVGDSDNTLIIPYCDADFYFYPTQHWAGTSIGAVFY